MDPLELLWLESREDPDLLRGEFADAAIRRVAPLLGRGDRDPHHAETAAADAVLDLLEHPDRFDPSRGHLVRFLYHVAYRDLQNLRDKEARHHRRRDHAEPVELAPDGRNSGQEDADMLEDHAGLREAIAGLPPAEQRVLALMRQGERATAAFAAALGLGDRPAAELAAEVKRVRDRIIARLKRAGRGT